MPSPRLQHPPPPPPLPSSCLHALLQRSGIIISYIGHCRCVGRAGEFLQRCRCSADPLPHHRRTCVRPYAFRNNSTLVSEGGPITPLALSAPFAPSPAAAEPFQIPRKGNLRTWLECSGSWQWRALGVFAAVALGGASKFGRSAEGRRASRVEPAGLGGPVLLLPSAQRPPPSTPTTHTHTHTHTLPQPATSLSQIAGIQDGRPRPEVRGGY